MEKKRILVIEDSPTQARLVGILLENAGFEVLVAYTGQEGIEMAESQSPDTILLDVVLPDFDGFSVCRRLRQNVLVYVPILMLTEKRIDLEDKVDGLQVGADEYLTKPFDPRELIARIIALLRVKQVIDDLHGRLVTETQSYQALRQIALVDRLTGVYNRHYFMEELEREFNQSQRYKTNLSCLMLDIDNFRDFNTQFGHPTGDWVLRNSAQLLQAKLRQGDWIARYGGEEFVILLPITELEGAIVIAERLHTLIEEAAWEHPLHGRLKITISFGVACYPRPAIQTPEQLLACADQALYRAKANGRNRVEAYQDSAPQDSAPQDSAPRDSAPRDSAPRAGG